MSRPKHPINWEQVVRLCHIQCTQEEVASVIGCCLDTLQNRCKEEHGITFSEFYKQKRQGGKASLRRNQWKMGETNPTMAIFLGKQYLGQSDKHHVEQETIQITIDGDDSEL